MLECVDSLLDPAHGNAIATPFTTAGSDDFTGSCGGDATKDEAYQWVVPFNDWFTIDMTGSDYDAVLYLLQDDCEGVEFACSAATSLSGEPSEITAQFKADDQYVIVLDGTLGSSGNAVLNINPVTCPPQDVGDGSSLPITQGTAGGTDAHGGDCGGDTSRERSYRFTPAESGLWRVSAKADVLGDLNPSVYLERGARCGGTLLQCNGHDMGGIGVAASVTRFIEAGESTTVIVDGRDSEGLFELNAEKIGDSCPLANVGPGDIVEDINTYSDTMTSSCGENSETQWGTEVGPFPDLVFGKNDLSPGGSMSCEVVISAGFPFSLAVMDGECTGPERHCNANATAAGDRWEMSYRLPKLGGKLTFVVSPILPSWQGWFGTSVEIHEQCVA